MKAHSVGLAFALDPRTWSAVAASRLVGEATGWPHFIASTGLPFLHDSRAESRDRRARSWSATAGEPPVRPRARRSGRPRRQGPTKGSSTVVKFSTDRQPQPTARQVSAVDVPCRPPRRGGVTSRVRHDFPGSAAHLLIDMCRKPSSKTLPDSPGVAGTLPPGWSAVGDEASSRRGASPWLNSRSELVPSVVSASLRASAVHRAVEISDPSVRPTPWPTGRAEIRVLNAVRCSPGA